MYRTRTTSNERAKCLTGAQRLLASVSQLKIYSYLEDVPPLIPLFVSFRRVLFHRPLLSCNSYSQPRANVICGRAFARIARPVYSQPRFRKTRISTHAAERVVRVHTGWKRVRTYARTTSTSTTRLFPWLP